MHAKSADCISHMKGMLRFRWGSSWFIGGTKMTRGLVNMEPELASSRATRETYHIRGKCTSGSEVLKMSAQPDQSPRSRASQ
eukprot:SM000318S12221  [mRNA]  locus=s318:63448:64419:+ [translate_table: standard]